METTNTAYKIGYRLGQLHAKQQLAQTGVAMIDPEMWSEFRPERWLDGYVAGFLDIVDSRSEELYARA